ncbi:MAG: S8 family serine peptidase [Ardenticatenaceae bacterium]|nr:S8 family serine peptidase [Ardenticatenaceae bacterium]MCB9444767.1 S8 family serine peptidase [Ardenticatenaceae bacterium]
MTSLIQPSNPQPAKNRHISFSVLVVLLALMMVVLTAVPATSQPQPTNVQPELLALAMEQPESEVRVMVQKTAVATDLTAVINQLDGLVIHDLHMINAIAAKLPAGAVPILAQNEGVNWVSLDGGVQSSSVVNETVRDEFGTVAYSNNNGTAVWAGDWLEIGESDGPKYGSVSIYNNQLRLKYSRRGIERAVDLSDAETAVLSFDYRRSSLDRSSDYIDLEISADGGASWTKLDSFTGPANDSSMRSASYNIIDYAGSDTIIRFATSDSLGSYDYLYVDNLEIAYTWSIVETPPTPPPTEELPGLDALDGIDFTFNVQDDLYTYVAYNYKNNSGSRNWSSPWMEINDDGATTTGDVRVSYLDGWQRHAFFEYGSSWNPVHGLWRTVNLSGATAAKLTFGYRRGAMEADDYLAAEISSDGGQTWVEVDRFYGGSIDSAFTEVSYNISPFISAETAVRFTANFNDSGSDYDNGYIFKANIDFNTPPMPMPPNYYLDTLNVPAVWAMGIKGDAIGIAVIDSGISPENDFKKEPDDYSIASMRLMTNVSFNIESSLALDTYGHGTHVASIAAGMGMNSDGFYKGVAPHAKLLSLKVADDNGMAYESDVVAALQWIYDLKGTMYEPVYNIRVVNLSINSTVAQSYHDSPLNTAVEILWLNNIVVVASAGNWINGFYNTINAAPANDPYIITVGASEENGNSNRADDYMAVFSSRGVTMDGYNKPEIIAPGRNIVATLSNKSWWRNDYPSNFVENMYFRASGTSMSAPMVSGAVALLLQSEPNLTPDQVKYRLTHTGSTMRTLLYGDYPYMDVYAAVTTPTTESANQDVIPNMLLAKMALIAYWASVNGDEYIDWSNVDWDAVNWDAVDWDAVDWNSVNWGSVNWGSVNWGSVNWGSVNWGSVNWGSVNWGSVNWGSVNWGSVNWGSVNWGSVNLE